MPEKHPELEEHNLEGLAPFNVNVDPMEIQQVEELRSKTATRIRDVLKRLNELDEKMRNTTNLGKKEAIISRKGFYVEEENNLRQLYNYYSEWQAHLGQFGGKRRRRNTKRSKGKKTRRTSRK